MLRLLTNALWVAVFLFMFWVALKNSDTATLRLTETASLTAPLIVIVLIAFGAGVLTALLATAPRLFRLNRELHAARGATRDAQPAVSTDSLRSAATSASARPDDDAQRAGA
ncbi:lipopolysaccharide assembly protein LapA domain-containing protein [Piscinibacterium candidicorallinum]|uniref:Lipopolysaccharide assembly protein LapA domain-containing protein n=1 Tax=Piscinibacterium candidicorallinum TaxID=1793872 RepID=A0ABV7H529_9BURK